MEHIKEFYGNCADILQIEIEIKDVPKVYERFDYASGKWVQRTTYKTRWNGRDPGNGRYPGFGIIRYYSSSEIHLNFSKPIPVNRMFKSVEEVYEFLSELMKDQPNVTNT